MKRSRTRFTSIAIGAATVAGTLALASSPAHAATASSVQRFVKNFNVSLNAPGFRCTNIVSNWEASYSVNFGGIHQQAAGRDFTCSFNGNVMTGRYWDEGSYGWDRFATLTHHFSLSYRNSAGQSFGCGDIGTQTNEKGTVINTFLANYSQFKIQNSNSRTCFNGPTVSASFSLSEGWGAS